MSYLGVKVLNTIPRGTFYKQSVRATWLFTKSNSTFCLILIGKSYSVDAGMLISGLSGPHRSGHYLERISPHSPSCEFFNR